MGWDYCTVPTNFADEVREKVEGSTYEDGGKVIAHHVRPEGNERELWIVVEKPNGDRVIGLILFRGNADRNGNACWGYTSMCEEMGPYYYDCPNEFLDMVPQPEGEIAAGWRAKVRARNAK